MMLRVRPNSLHPVPGTTAIAAAFMIVRLVSLLLGVMAKPVRTGGASAEKSEMPGFINPQLATPKPKAPKATSYLHFDITPHRHQSRRPRGRSTQPTSGLSERRSKS
jgi:hypothetical protein